jgi:hypothetical protein
VRLRQRAGGGFSRRRTYLLFTNLLSAVGAERSSDDQAAGPSVFQEKARLL